MPISILTLRCHHACRCVCVQVLFDIGYVSTPEPFQRLVSQGMILGEVEYTVMQDASGAYVPDGTPGAQPLR
jgi:leucyl-tRNA synthetase